MHAVSPTDEPLAWLHGMVYRIDDDAIVIVEVFQKKTQATPRAVIAVCRRRLREYDNA